MDEYPIQGLMKTAMQSIREMVDVNTIVGDAVNTVDGTVIIPISKVSFGFAAGGAGGTGKLETNIADGGFGGGSGAGVSVKPVGFLVCAKDKVHFLSVEKNSICERLTDYIPQTIEILQNLVGKKEENDTKTDNVEENF